VMEKASNVVVCPMDLMRSDIWSWDAIDQLLTGQKVINTNPYLLLDDKNNLVFSKQKIIVDGIENTFIIMTEAGLYVAKKWNSQTLHR
jgi:mannose-1-phosphate guanylyltransferase